MSADVNEANQGAGVRDWRQGGDAIEMRDQEALATCAVTWS